MMFPSRNIILTSYSSHFASDWGRKIRNTIEEFGVHCGVSLDPRSTAADRFNTEKGGELVAVGVGGAITGRGAHLLIIDDPVKTIEEVFSRTQRDKVWDWFRSVAYTRLEPDGHAILVMTRWHEDDLAGRILENDKDNWEVVRIPAIAEEGDVLGREVGEPLWGDRFGKSELSNIRSVIGSMLFTSLYQQSPTALEGEVFKSAWFDEKIKMTPPDLERVVMYCDLAASEKTTADYTAVAVMGIDEDDNIWVLSMRRERLEWGAVKRLIASEADKYKPAVIGVESVGMQAVLVKDLMDALPQYAVVGKTPKSDKLSRALPLAARAEAGKVFLVKGHWNGALIDELITFPRGEHDDQVDALSGGYEMLMEHKAVKVW